MAAEKLAGPQPDIWQMTTNLEKLDQGDEFLNANGFNMKFVFDTDAVKDVLGPAMPVSELEKYHSLVLIGNAGSALWHAMEQHGCQGADPIDDFSARVATAYAAEYLESKAILLYPSSYLISLTELGKRARWSFVSPIGLGIHPKFGLWFAYRAVLLVEVRLHPTAVPEWHSPCDTCVDKPCQTSCPPGAVTEPGSFGLETCSLFRLRENSPCARKCLARLSCPVGAEYRYATEQMNYFYDRSIITISRYFGAAVDADRS